MTRPSTKCWRLGFLLVLGAGLPLAHFGLTPSSAESRTGNPPSVVPLFAKTEPAKNPTQLCVQADEQKVVGWISGTRSYAGEKVTITIDGKMDRVIVDKDNTFTWNYKIDKPVTATVALVCDGILQKIALTPATSQEPTVFFVVDRSAYRPSQTLHFAGFLRQLNAKGEFVPLTARTVDVQLASERKNTVAAKLKLDADEFGRVTGSYTFSDADALDNYTLSIPGYKGSAKVYLGEYRKSKVKLNITGEVVEGKLKLKFQAVDFLDKPVAGSQISFTAQVAQKAGREKKYTLRGEDFVHNSVMPLGQIDFEDLPEDELLLWEVDGSYLPTFAPKGSTVLAQVDGKIELKEKEPGEYSIELKSEWLKGNCSVIVQGVVVDANGREQRATQTISLEPTKKCTIQILAKKRYYGVNEPIEVNLRPVDVNGAMDASTTLVAMKLAVGAAVPVYDYYDDFRYSSRRILSAAYIRPRWAYIQPSQTISRSLATAVAFKDGQASLKLSEPGAYKLVAITTLTDGSKVQNEIGVVVRNVEDQPGIVLQLDQDEYTAGSKLTGMIHSRFANAKVLLTLRDSSGIRLARPLQLKDSMLLLSEPLPADLRYGCAVDVQYLDEEKQVYTADRFIRVVPADRMLSVETKLKETVQPGETVHVDFKVNRNEPVDLVVSVYDQALLGIAPDRSVDIRNFYLADERARLAMSREAIRRKLGDVTVKELVEKAQETQKKWQGEADPMRERQALQFLIANYTSNKYLSVADIATLLHLAGLEVRPNWNYFMNYGYNWISPLADEERGRITLVQVLDRRASNEWRLSYQLSQNTILLGEMHANQLYYGRRYYGFNAWGNQWNNGLMFQQMNGNQFMARGDAHRSLIASGNAMHSVEAQGFVSHLPAQGAPVELINTDADQSHINVRRDFSDAAFWNAKLRTDSQGRASIDFKLPD